jgi:hypothetical protein
MTIGRGDFRGRTLAGGRKVPRADIPCNRFVRTPNYGVVSMYAAHQWATSARGGAIRVGRGTVLASRDLQAHNRVDRPDALRPRDQSVTPQGNSLRFEAAPASVTRLALDLA